MLVKENGFFGLRCALAGFAIAALLAITGAQGAFAQSDSTGVSTEGGRVMGAAGKAPGIMQFKGIPYAAPPVGDLRWKPPAPAPHWSSVLHADHFAPDCFSPRPDSSPTQSEDCLYLNIWSPAHSTAKLPVMVWIYGGGFSGGSAADPHFDGTHLSRKGVILVTFGYRTSIFGYLNHPLLTAESPHHVSGNYGLLDAIAALEWVKRNIAAFGGDPKNVTIFGQSSGSESVHALTVSPLAHGLFAKAIGESGSGFGVREPPTLAKAEARGASAVQSLGATLPELRARSAEELAKAAGTLHFEPVIDGWLLPTDAYDIYAHGRPNDVATLVGVNTDEVQVPPGVTQQAYLDRVHERFGAQSPAILAAFPANDDQQARDATQRLNGLMFIDFGVDTWAGGQLRTGHEPVWQYRFGHPPPPNPEKPLPLGARHGDEIRYVFDNLDQEQRAWTDQDRKLADIMSSYWTNFARSGDPNGPGLPRWDRLSLKEPRMLMINDSGIAMTPRPNSDGVALLERVLYGQGGVYRPEP